MTKYIFVTGGVVSGLGKGITAASIGLILKSSGLSVDVIKFDPYLNVDPGTMSPYEHGEVYVLEDGSETDLDLGHYERFLEVNLTKVSSVTSGKIYAKILDDEREGKYLGKNVQIIPHVTNSIKQAFTQEANTDVRLIEIGGSSGDYEGDLYLESLRQFRRENRRNFLHVHLGYVPFLACSGEYKTKPMQTSLRELSRSGLQPDVLIARSEATDDRPLSKVILEKLALFGNVPSENVISLPDQSDIYDVPNYLQHTTLTQVLEKYVGFELKPKFPKFFLKKNQKFKKTVNVALIAKYNKLSDAYLSVIESLRIAGADLEMQVKVQILDSQQEDLLQKLELVDAIIVPGGFGNRGMEGKIRAIEWARVNKKPFLGICLGLQLAVVEFARNLAGISNAVSSEMFDSRKELQNKEVVIDLIPEQLKIAQKGGTMRLGAYDCKLTPNTKIHQLFGTDNTRERHRHRLEVQSKYLPILEQKGLVVSGKHYLNGSEENFLVEMIELPTSIHPYFVATQSHPEFLSRPSKPHPLFRGLLESLQTL